MMSNRTIRRAAERQALKAAARQQKSQEAEPQAMSAAAGASTEPSSPNVDFAEERTTSEAQFTANRANAQKSTGPVTPAGRAKSSLNAVKTGLTGQTVLLPTDDAKAYQAHLDRHFKHHAPANDQEHTLVQMIADAEWRILRIPGLEASIYALGRLKLADLHPEQTDPAVRESLITGEVLLAYRRDLSNLALQERRLRNQHKSDLEKLAVLQDERLEKTNEKGKIQKRMMDAIRTMTNTKKVYGTFVPVEFGFEFSLYEIEYCEHVLGAAHRRGDTPPCVADILANMRSNQKEAQAA
jgi:hypothetical protein